MTSFETVMPFLALALVLLTGALSILCARVERRLAGRKKISLSNYKEKNALFYILNDIPVAVISIAAGVGALAFLVVCAVNPVLRFYTPIYGVMVCVNAAIAVLSMTRRKCGRDIRLFDTYYVQVEHVLGRKERTLSEIQVCRRRVDELRDRLTQTVHEFNQNLAQGVSVDFLPSLFAPIDRMIGAYIEEINRFTAAVEKNFDEALQEFLHNETVPEFQMVPLRTFDESEVDDLLASIKSSYGDRIAEMVVEQVNRGAVKSARSLGNIMSLLHKLQVQMDKETLARFLQAASRFNDRAELTTLLYRNRQISAAMVREIFIPQNWEWAFSQGMAEAFNHKELTAILTEVLAANSSGMCYRLLSQFDASLMHCLDGALEAEQKRSGEETNGAYRLAKAYRLMLSHSFVVGNSGNLFENMCYMLYDRGAELGLTEPEQGRIAELVRTERFFEARREITELYGKAMRSGAPLVASAGRILLQYIMIAPADFLDPARLCAVFAEYRETLSFADIGTVRALLAAWLLRHSKDAGVLTAVLRELTAIPVGEPFATAPTAKEAKKVATALLAHLMKNDGMRLRSVIYRTEQERQTLDRIKTI